MGGICLERKGDVIGKKCGRKVESVKKESEVTNDMMQGETDC
jgi:hypothetical protein